jgi:addiction module HigA family antidote
MPNKISMTHPGIILRDEFFAPLNLTQLSTAKATGIPQSRLSEILAGRRSSTADTAARLGRFFGVDPRNWLNLQTAYDLWLVERDHGPELARVSRLESAAA